VITYAQNFEDVILARLFAEQDGGFYVDIGAGQPSNLSVTRHFYERGWRGVNVEPIRRNWEAFVRERPRDLNLNVAVSTSPGSREFCEVIDNDALSSLDVARIARLRAGGANIVLYPVECVTGDVILDQCSSPVDFIKIDVEGAEDDVLRSIDLRRHQPKVLVVEATAPLDSFPGWKLYSPQAYARWDAWEPYVTQSGYRFVHFDGLNRFYVRADLGHLAERLALPPGVFDFILPDLEKALNEQRQASEAAFTAALQERQAEVRSLKEAASRLEIAVADAGKEELRRLNEALEEKATTVTALSHLVKSLDEKEAVIQELSKALESYRKAFSVMRFFLWPVAALAASVRYLRNRSRALLMPKLGNLNHHAPRDLHLPPHYSQPRQLATHPRICIVTPSFRQASFIERTIRSVLDQGYPNLEYFVQDGGSDDGTLEILERYGDRLASWDSRPDSGQTEAINRGFERVDGEIMAWINSDDILLPGALAFVADYFNGHPEIDVIYGHRILIDENEREIGRWILPPHDDRILSWADYVPQETLFWRRRIWNEVGARVDESFRFAMDWDLLVRFRDAGARFARVPRFLGAFRIHPQQKTSASISDIGFKEMDRIRERALGRVPSRMEIAKAVLPYLMRHVASDFAWRARARLGGQR
jgi:FkbM family methyltransferase